MLKNKKVKYGVIVFAIAIILIIVGLILVGLQKGSFEYIQMLGAGSFFQLPNYDHIAIAKAGIVLGIIIGPILGFGSLIWFGFVYFTENYKKKSPNEIKNS